MMMWDEWVDSNEYEPQHNQNEQEYFNFEFLSLLSKPKDYYKILEVDYDATEDAIRSNYIRLALQWHPDKKKDQDCATSRFQEINEAYRGKLIKFLRHERLDEGFDKYKETSFERSGKKERIRQ